MIRGMRVTLCGMTHGTVGIQGGEFLQALVGEIHGLLILTTIHIGILDTLLGLVIMIHTGAGTLRTAMVGIDGTDTTMLIPMDFILDTITEAILDMSTILQEEMWQWEVDLYVEELLHKDQEVVLVELILQLAREIVLTPEISPELRMNITVDQEVVLEVV